MSDNRFSEDEIRELTKFKHATKQLNVLHARGFVRAWIDRSGKVVLERPHFDAVSRGELQQPRKAANLTFLRKTA